VEHSAKAPRLLVEYWAHEAALMSVDDWPLLRWRMREYEHGAWGTEIVKKNGRLAEDVGGAVANWVVDAGQIEAHLEVEQRGRKGPWWDRSDTKWVAEALWFRRGSRVDEGRFRGTTTSASACFRRRCSRVTSTTPRRCGSWCWRAAGALGVGTRPTCAITSAEPEAEQPAVAALWRR